ncbi:MAG TPA: hypothetical protein PKH19_01640, partial [Candidatus Syntrophosphaera sp.]|nr:hypothetical protein [Candidatus Syntrophosphaera sp.]
TKNLAANASIDTQLTAGAILDINSGATLTLNGQLSASQIIQGQGILLIAGSSSQLQLPACNLATITLNRANGCQMIAPSSVSTLNLNLGTFALASQTLTLYGQINGSGALSGGSAAGLLVAGTSTALSLPATLSLLSQLTLDRPNGCSLLGDLAATTINLYSGSLNVGSHILTFHGALNITSGILSTNSGSTLSVQSGSVDLNLPALSTGALIMNRSGRSCTLGGTTSVGNLSLAAGTLALGAQTLTVSGSLIHSGGSLSGGPQAQLTLTPTVTAATIPSLNLLRYKQMCPISVNLSGSLQVSEIGLQAGILNLADYSLTISGGFMGGTIVPNAGSLAGSPSSTLILTADNVQPWQLPPASIGNLSCDLSGGCLMTEPVFLQSGLFLVNGAASPGGSLSLGAGSLIVRQAGWLSGPPTLGGNIRVHYLQSNLTGFELPGQPGYIAQIIIMGLDTTVTAGSDVYLGQRLQLMPGCIFDITAHQLVCAPGTVIDGQGQLFGQVQIDIGNMGIYAPPAGLQIEPGPLITGFAFSHLPVAQQINSVNSIQRSWNLQGDFTGVVQIHFLWLPEADNGIPFSHQTPAYVYRQNDDWWEQLGDPTDVSMQVPRSIGISARQFSLWTVGPAAPLSPPFLLDFELGFKHCRVANGDQINGWVTGDATAWRNSHSAYISDDGTSHQYETTQPGYAHLWFDLRFPDDMSDVRLRFEWRGMGESGSDFLSVSLLECWEMPLPGQPAGGQQLGQMYGSSPDWQLVTIPFSFDLAGLDKRIVFSWQNDPGGGDQPPAALDNVRVVTGLPVPGVPLISGFDHDGGQALLYWEESVHANDYLIEWCAEPSAGFLPLTVQYNSPLPVDLDSPRKFFRIRALD